MPKRNADELKNPFSYIFFLVNYKRKPVSAVKLKVNKITHSYTSKGEIGTVCKETKMSKK